jgi:ATP-dependent Clp protease ATP-binding subunit ClpX
METAMLDVMYELPSEPDARECVISEQVIINNDYPVVLYENSKKKKSA